MKEIDTISSFYLSQGVNIQNKSNLFDQDQNFIYSGTINFYITNQPHLLNLLYTDIFETFQKMPFLVFIKNGDLYFSEITLDNGQVQQLDKIIGFLNYKTMLYSYNDNIQEVNIAKNVYGVNENDYIGLQAITSIQLNGSSNVLSVTINISFLSQISLRDKSYIITKSKEEKSEQTLYFYFRQGNNQHFSCIEDSLQLRYIYTYSIGSKFQYNFDLDSKMFLYKPIIYYGYGNKNLQISSQYDILNEYNITSYFINQQDVGIQITMDKYFSDEMLFIDLKDIYNIQFYNHLNTKTFTIRQGIPRIGRKIEIGVDN